MQRFSAIDFRLRIVRVREPRFERGPVPLERAAARLRSLDDELVPTCLREIGQVVRGVVGKTVADHEKPQRGRVGERGDDDKGENGAAAEKGSKVHGGGGSSS